MAAERAAQWMGDLEALPTHLDAGFHELTPAEYALTLRSFFRRLLKVSEVCVTDDLLAVNVPVGEGGTMSVRELLEDVPRDRLFCALELLVEHNGDLAAAQAAEEVAE